MAAVRGRLEEVPPEERVGDELHEEGGGVGHDRGVDRRWPGHRVALWLRAHSDRTGSRDCNRGKRWAQLSVTII